MVSKLPAKLGPPAPGPLEAVQEVNKINNLILTKIFQVPTATNYYDGEKKLNTIKIKCKIHANPTECLHHSSCGWCSASNSCIIGNNMGPLEPCVKSSFIFSAPYPNFNPKTKVINENVGGLSMTVITK